MASVKRLVSSGDSASANRVFSNPMSAAMRSYGPFPMPYDRAYVLRSIYSPFLVSEASA